MNVNGDEENENVNVNGDEAENVNEDGVEETGNVDGGEETENMNVDEEAGNANDCRDGNKGELECGGKAGGGILVISHFSTVERTAHHWFVS